MNYQDIIKKCEESRYLTCFIPIEEIVSFGYSLDLNPASTVLDLGCGYGTVLKIWHEAFGISGTGLDICHDYIREGKRRLQEAGIDRIRLIEGNVFTYSDSEKYDVVICNETYDSIEKTLLLGEKFLKAHGVLVYQKAYSKIEIPNQEKLDYGNELLSIQELNQTFINLGYYITHMVSDSNPERERYITWSARRDLAALRNSPQDSTAKDWLHKWYQMNFDNRRWFQGQAFFGLERL
jgi:ubiquinone/menaquinone biosynthesis C-methylase UbiE